jgi:hypothetical protein
MTSYQDEADNKFSDHPLHEQYFQHLMGPGRHDWSCTFTGDND